MAKDRGTTQNRHPAPVRQAHRFPVKDADGGHHHGAGDPGPEKTDHCRVAPRDIAGQEPVKREHRGGDQRHDGGGRKDRHAGLKDHQNPGKADRDGQPAPPADLLAQNRAGEGGDEKRVTGKDRVAFDKAQQGKGCDHHADLRRQQHTARDLDQRKARAQRRAKAAGKAGGQRDGEAGEEPVADHHHHEDVVGLGKVARNPVLQGKDQTGADHQPGAEAVVLFGHVALSNSPRLICRLLPYPDMRST